MAYFRDYKFKKILRDIVTTTVDWRIHKGEYVLEDDPITKLPVSVYKRLGIEEDRTAVLKGDVSDAVIRTTLNKEFLVLNTSLGYETIPQQINPIKTDTK